MYKHHIIPKHEWKLRFGNLDGVDASDNICYLTLEQHILAHKMLYEQFGRWQDDLAVKMMSGCVGLEEGIRKAQSLSNIGYNRNKNRIYGEDFKLAMSRARKGKKFTPHTKEARKKKSEMMRGERRALGSKHSLESKIARSIRMTGKKRGPYKKKVQ